SGQGSVAAPSCESQKVKAAARSKSMPSGRKPEKKAQPVIPACSEPSAHRSIQRWGAGTLTVPCLASQLRVKLGMIRPPTTEIRTTIAARPRRHPSSWHPETAYFEVHQKIGDGENRDWQSHRKVAPVSPGG